MSSDWNTGGVFAGFQRQYVCGPLKNKTQVEDNIRREKNFIFKIAEELRLQGFDPSIIFVYPNTSVAEHLRALRAQNKLNFSELIFYVPFYEATVDVWWAHPAECTHYCYTPLIWSVLVDPVARIMEGIRDVLNVTVSQPS